MKLPGSGLTAAARIERSSLADDDHRARWRPAGPAGRRRCRRGSAAISSGLWPSPGPAGGAFQVGPCGQPHQEDGERGEEHDQDHQPGAAAPDEAALPGAAGAEAPAHLIRKKRKKLVPAITANTTIPTQGQLEERRAAAVRMRGDGGVGRGRRDAGRRLVGVDLLRIRGRHRGGSHGGGRGRGRGGGGGGDGGGGGARGRREAVQVRGEARAAGRGRRRGRRCPPRLGSDPPRPGGWSRADPRPPARRRPGTVASPRARRRPSLPSVARLRLSGLRASRRTALRSRSGAAVGTPAAHRGVRRAGRDPGGPSSGGYRAPGPPRASPHRLRRPDPDRGARARTIAAGQWPRGPRSTPATWPPTR